MCEFGVKSAVEKSAAIGPDGKVRTLTKVFTQHPSGLPANHLF